MLRNSADARTVVCVLLAPALVIVQIVRPDWIVYLCWISCYLALACGVVAHNHNHYPTFRSRWWNQALSNLVSIFYGYPVFAWIPTHNQNHHRYVNRPGDDTITWRHGNNHDVLHAASYFFVSSYSQGAPIREYIQDARLRHPERYRRIRFQYLIWAGMHTLALTVGLAAYGVADGVLVWLFVLGLPALFALSTIMFFNYEQHVHTDAWSEKNHSRNFIGPVTNFLLFNNGFHTAHHENPGLHWSELPEAHARIQSSIHPDLIQRNTLLYLFRQYIIAPFSPSHGTRQIGCEPKEAAGRHSPAGARSV
jgi:fatty acid desaturase